MKSTFTKWKSMKCCNTSLKFQRRRARTTCLLTTSKANKSKLKLTTKLELITLGNLTALWDMLSESFWFSSSPHHYMHALFSLFIQEGLYRSQILCLQRLRNRTYLLGKLIMKWFNFLKRRNSHWSKMTMRFYSCLHQTLNWLYLLKFLDLIS
jgi:hypothetical protein